MKRVNINGGWTFYAKGHEHEAVTVHLPHDAMIHEKRIPRLGNGPMTSEFPGGDYTYRKNLFGKEAYAGKTVMLAFEGVYMDSMVCLNDEITGGRFYDYSHFYADLTGKLRIGAVFGGRPGAAGGHNPGNITPLTLLHIMQEVEG